jgi:flagellin-like protein
MRVSTGDAGGPVGERGVSPVVGVVLLTAIAVVLAGVIATLAVGFEDQLRDPAPSGGFDREYAPTGADNTADRPYVTITHQVGRTIDAENVVIRDESGNEITWADVWTGGPEVHAQEYVHLDGFGSDAALDPICEAEQSYVIVLEDDEGDSLLVTEWEVPTDPDLPEGSPSDSDGDGIPDWC